MKPAPFQYIAADSLEQALEIMGEHADAAKPLAGGQSLIPSMNFRVVQPTMLVDLNRLEQLRYINSDGEGLAIGSMTTQRQLERHPAVGQDAPLLAEALPHIAHPQIRNRGTLGGSLVHADPAAELPVIALALRARLKARSRTGERWIAAGDFFQGMFATDLRPDELLVEIVFPPLPAGAGWSFLELSRRQGDYAMMGLAALLVLDSEGVCQQARLVYLNAGDGPVEAGAALQPLLGNVPAESIYAEVARLASQDEIEPFGNVHATPEYQRHLARVLTLRALGLAEQRARDRLGLNT